MKEPFYIHVSDDILTDLQRRLAATRWPNEMDNEEWKTGTNETYLKELCSYWQSGFDWKKQEEYLNTFDHFKATIDDIQLHFLSEGKGILIDTDLAHTWLPRQLCSFSETYTPSSYCG